MQQLRRRASFHHLALVQYHHLIAHMVDHRQIVPDDDVGHAKFLLQLQQQIQHLGLHRDIQRADRLVGHDQARARDDGPRNGDALALAARKGVRVALRILGAQAHLFQGLGHAFVDFRFGQWAQRGQRFGHAPADGAPGVEGGIGVLKDHLKIAPRLAQLRRRQGVQVLPIEQDVATGGGVQRHDEARQRGFAAARPAHDAQAAPGVQCQVHIAQGRNVRGQAQQVAPGQVVVFAQLLHVQQRWGQVLGVHGWLLARDGGAATANVRCCPRAWRLGACTMHGARPSCCAGPGGQKSWEWPRAEAFPHGTRLG